MNLNTKEIIKGVIDEKLGDYYNNPSFGYGDIVYQKIQSNLKLYKNIPQELISAVVASIVEKTLLLTILY